jgi:3-oxoacyl-[acyl-carrier protein] reductase
MKNRKQNIFIVGIGGSLGNVLHKYYNEDVNYKVYGGTTKIENQSESIFFIDFMNSSSINNLPHIPIDHLIITAGYEPKFNLDQMTESHLGNMIGIHLSGPILLIQKMQSMLSDRSSITFISSPAAWQGSYDPTYAAVKGAVNGLVRTLAKDLAPRTRVNAFSPSLIEESTVFNGMTPDFKQRHIDRTLNKRLLTLDECIDAIEFIINSKHFTGQILHLNGGMVYG